MHRPLHRGGTEGASSCTVRVLVGYRAPKSMHPEVHGRETKVYSSTYGDGSRGTERVHAMHRACRRDAPRIPRPTHQALDGGRHRARQSDPRSFNCQTRQSEATFGTRRAPDLAKTPGNQVGQDRLELSANGLRVPLEGYL